MAIVSREEFKKVYEEELIKAIRSSPDKYHFHENEAGTIAEKMVSAIFRKSANKEGQAFKATCKRLGIKYTYSGIYEALGI